VSELAVSKLIGRLGPQVRGCARLAQ